MESSKQKNSRRNIFHPEINTKITQTILKRTATEKHQIANDKIIVENDINLILKDTQIIQMIKDSTNEMSVHIKCNVGNKPYLRFIVDTGSQCSFILTSALKKDTRIYPQFKKIISGISGNTVESKGTVFVTMNIANKLLMHEFQVMPEGLFEAEGLWGADLLNQMDILSTSNRIIVKKLLSEKVARKKLALEKLDETFEKHIANPDHEKEINRILIFKIVEQSGSDTQPADTQSNDSKINPRQLGTQNSNDGHRINSVKSKLNEENSVESSEDFSKPENSYTGSLQPLSSVAISLQSESSSTTSTISASPKTEHSSMWNQPTPKIRYSGWDSPSLESSYHADHEESSDSPNPETHSSDPHNSPSLDSLSFDSEGLSPLNAWPDMSKESESKERDPKDLTHEKRHPNSSGTGNMKPEDSRSESQNDGDLEQENPNTNGTHAKLGQSKSIESTEETKENLENKGKNFSSDKEEDDSFPEMEDAKFWFKKKKKNDEKKISKSFLIRTSTETYLKINTKLQEDDYLMENKVIKKNLIETNAAIKVTQNKTVFKDLKMNDTEKQVAQTESVQKFQTPWKGPFQITKTLTEEDMTVKMTIDKDFNRSKILSESK